MSQKLFNKPLKILLATNGIILIAGAMLAPIYAIFVEKIGGDLLDASLTGGIFAFTAGITTIISGRYADKIKENKLIVVFGYLLIGFGFLLLNFATTIWMLFLIQILIGFAEALYSPTFDALYSKHLKKDMAGREWGAWEGVNYFSITIGAVTGGLMANYLGFNILFTVMSVLSFLSAIYIYILPRKVL